MHTVIAYYTRTETVQQQWYWGLMRPPSKLEDRNSPLPGEIKAFKVKNIRRYGPLRGPTSSSCGGLRPSAEAFFAHRAKKELIMLFWPIFSNFWCLVITLVTFSNNIRNFERNPKKPKKIRKKSKKDQKNSKSKIKKNQKNVKKYSKNPTKINKVF